MGRDRQSIEGWEALVGEQVREARIAGGLDQARLAALADVSVGALSSLERGKGSSLKTVVAVIGALDRTDWLAALVPLGATSSMSTRHTDAPAPKRRYRVRSSRFVAAAR